jgi:hypothetical protein
MDRKVLKLTKGLSQTLGMEENSLGAQNYLEWCTREALRIGCGCYVKKWERNGFKFCRIERPVSWDGVAESKAM